MPLALQREYTKNSGRDDPPPDAKRRRYDISPQKMLPNPAATTTQVSNKHRSEETPKPQYQTDKIIIPSKLKSKQPTDSAPNPTAEAETTLQVSNVQPTFTTKDYSLDSRGTNVRGILGVEYVIKILKSSSDTCPRYECGLCELVLDSFAMQCHLEGYSHRLKFCEKHFPTAMRHYRQYMHGLSEQDSLKVMTKVLLKLSIAIESYHGRNLPYDCYERDFSLNRHQILAKAFSCRHASEQYGPTFTHVIDSKEITQFINEQYNNETSFTSESIFDTNMRDKIQTTASLNKPILTNTTLRDPHVPINARASSFKADMRKPISNYSTNSNVDVIHTNTYQPEEENDSIYEDLPESSFNSKAKLGRKNNTDVFMRFYYDIVDKEVSDLSEKFTEYRYNPELLPTYGEEWQQFWKRRKNELIAEGIDHRQYNYQPDWIRYIKKRLDELFKDEVETIKQKTRKTLGLPLTNNNKI